MKKILYPTILAIILSISLPAEAVYVLDVSIHNHDDTPAGGIQFPGLQNLVLGNNLWVISSQYIRVVYGSHEVNWAVRIITKNSTDIGGVYPKPLALGDDNQWEWVVQGLSGYQNVNGAWQTGDDVVAYGGLINLATKNDPNSRAPLAWQVFRYNDPYYPNQAENPSPPPTPLNDQTVGGGPIDSWAYTGDAADSGYVQDPINNYFWVSYGSGGFSLLAQHPVVYTNAQGNALPKPGGGDMVIYLGARFGKKAPDGINDVSVLPAGNYQTKIYLELIHW